MESELKTSVSGYETKSLFTLSSPVGRVKHPLRESDQQRRTQVRHLIPPFHELQIRSLSDPFAVLYQKTEDAFIEMGRTEIIPNNLNPKFVRPFQILYEFERVQSFKVEVYDADEDKPSTELILSEQDFLGAVEFKLSELMTSTEGKLELILLGKNHAPLGNSKILFYYEEQTNQSDLVDISISCTLEGKPLQVFLRISKQHEDKTWIPTYSSEVIGPQIDLQYQWKHVHMTLRQICNANINRPLLFEVMKFQTNGKHVEIGRVILTLKEVEEMVDGSTPLAVPKRSKTTGSFEINSFERNPSPSFLEYISSGFEICFLVAIDFTKSNGTPDYPGSLHHLPNEASVHSDEACNVYEEAILGVGRVLEAYDSDKLFPTWGFGAKLSSESNVVSHCFAVNGNDTEPECDGIAGVLEAYRGALHRVQLAGPTFFSPVIRAAANLANKADGTRKYYCLLIITDGTLMDMTTAKREIIDASSLPLSIMIVGVGNEDFKKMVELDSDSELLSEGGLSAERDIVQFVEFAKHKNSGHELAEELLAEFPGQFLSYMKKNEIPPSIDPEPIDIPDPPPEDTPVPDSSPLEAEVVSVE
eukprot:g6288.t1